MEFSFDRSKESAHLRNGTQASGPTEQPQTTQQTQSSNDGADTSTITNERLRKAIEKNRARQAERNRTHPPASEAPQSQHTQQASFFDNQQQQQQQQPQQQYGSSTVQEEPVQQAPPRRARAEERTHIPNQKAAVVTRRSVARPDEAEFTPVKRTPKKVASQISYTTSSSRKKSKPFDPTLVGYLVKGCWIFCAVMVLRLLFAHGGVSDFYSQSSLHSDRLTELDRIKKENMQLVREIERMQTDTAFQKKLVRDNLGFIAADEFLVLFPK